MQEPDFDSNFLLQMNLKREKVKNAHQKKQGSLIYKYTFLLADKIISTPFSPRKLKKDKIKEMFK